MRDRVLRILPAPDFLPAALLFAAALPLACGGAPAGYPDTSGVTQAQKEWCQALAKGSGKGDKWEYMSDCKAAYPTASAEYLKRMAKCLSEHIGDNEDAAIDYGQVTAGCNDDVTLRLPADGPGAGQVIKARCEWMLRCRETPLMECKEGVDKLETAQRAIFTTTYNAAALHDIAGCLDSAACHEDEEVGLSECYKSPLENLLWFPK
jgi:hypothetical protein